MTTSGHPSTSLIALDKITNTLPIELIMKEQAINCSARLNAQGVSNGSTTGKGLATADSNGTPPIAILETAVDSHPCKGEELDLTKPTLNLDTFLIDQNTPPSLTPFLKRTSRASLTVRK